MACKFTVNSLYYKELNQGEQAIFIASDRILIEFCQKLSFENYYDCEFYISDKFDFSYFSTILSSWTLCSFLNNDPFIGQYPLAEFEGNFHLE